MVAVDVGGGDMVSFVVSVGGSGVASVGCDCDGIGV